MDVSQSKSLQLNKQEKEEKKGKTVKELRQPTQIQKNCTETETSKITNFCTEIEAYRADFQVRIMGA